MVTLEKFLMGRDKKYPLTEEQKQNAEDMVRRINSLLALFGQSRAINSGYRPPEVNASTPGAAKRSKHMECNAGDIEDADGALDAWCMANLDKLAEIGLWLEHPSATRTPKRFGHGWCHVQRVPPRSGNRVFYP